MAYHQWRFYHTMYSTASIVLVGQPGHPISPPVGSGWLHWSLTAKGYGGVAVPQSGQLTRGLLRGRIRSLFYYVARGSYMHNYFGVMSMCNQEDLRPGNGGTGYGAVLHDCDGITTVQLIKMTNGLSGISSIVLAESQPGIWKPSTVVALDLAWDASPSTRDILHGVVCTVSIGFHTDYSDITPIPEITNYVDDEYPYIDTVTEGIGVFGFFDGYTSQTKLIGL